MKTPEALVKDRIKSWLRERGAYFFMPVQTGFGASTLDILCCINGRFVGIECKRPTEPGMPKGRVTPRQINTIDAIRAAGGIAFVAEGVADCVRELGP